MTEDRLHRLNDWRPRLIALVEDRRDRPYQYGETDCACFALDAIETITGVRHFDGVERPRNWIGAAKFMMSRGWSGIDEMMDSILEPVDPKETVIGDLVAFRSNAELHLAVRAGDSALTPGDNGLMTIDRERWSLGWKIG